MGDARSQTTARAWPSGTDPQRRAQAECRTEDTADQGADGQDSPDDETHGGVHTAEEAVGAQPLAEAHLVHVVDRRGEADQEHPEAEVEEPRARRGEWDQQGSDTGGDAQDGGPRPTETPSERRGGERRPRTPPTPPMVKSRPITPGDAWTCSDQEEDLDGGGDAAEQVGGGRGRRDGAQERVTEDEAQTLLRCRGRVEGVHPPARQASVRARGWRRRRRLTQGN